jgi:hypothetical protein
MAEGQVPDVARDPKVIAKSAELLKVLRNYIEQAEEFELTDNWESELEMMHIRQYDIPGAIKALNKAAGKFYKKHPSGYVDR